jgi:hypothetical protein
MLDDLLGQLETVVQRTVNTSPDERCPIELISQLQALRGYGEVIGNVSYVKCAASPTNVTPGTVCHDSDFVGIEYVGQARKSPSLC